MSRSKNPLKDTLFKSERKSRRRGFLVNENKTKYMQVARAVFNDEHLCDVDNTNLSTLKNSQMNQTNPNSSEIQARILSRNRCYYAYGKLMKSRALNRSSKLKIYVSFKRPVVTFGCEAWALTDRDEQHLRIFERRILKKNLWPSAKRRRILEN
jgi:hypothetical protein